MEDGVWKPVPVISPCVLGCPEAASGRWLYELDVGLNATINLQFL